MDDKKKEELERICWEIALGEVMRIKMENGELDPKERPAPNLFVFLSKYDANAGERAWIEENYARIYYEAWESDEADGFLI